MTAYFRCGFTLRSTWYKGPVINVPLSDGDIEKRLVSFYKWYKAKFKNKYEAPAEMLQPEICVPMLREPLFVGVKDGEPVLIRYLHSPISIYNQPVNLKENACWKVRMCAPRLFVVSHMGKRIDGFLKLENAKRCAQQYMTKKSMADYIKELA